MADYPNPDAFIFKPIVPFYKHLPYKCKCGLLILIKGTIPENAESFYIYLLGDDSINNKANCDVIFKFNPRFDENVVIRDSRINGKWVREEKFSKLKFPFQSGSSFKLLILVQDDSFKVAVDENHFVDYHHQTDLDKIKWMEINDDVEIEKIEYRIDPKYIRVKQLSVISNYFYKPRIPFSFPLEEKNKVNLMIFLSGRPHLRANRFTVDLKSGESIALHLSVRFDEECIVTNSMNQEWNEEERFKSYFPFEPGLNFDLIIFIKYEKFLISINGQHCIDFKHRLLPIESINKIKVKGDFLINAIGFS